MALSCATTSASLAGVMPCARRASSVRGTFMSTSMRATSMRGHRHRLFHYRRVEVIAGDEEVDHVEIGLGDAVEFDDAAAGDIAIPGFGSCGLDDGGKAVLGVLDGEFVEPQGPLVPVLEPAPTIRAHLTQAFPDAFQPGSPFLAPKAGHQTGAASTPRRSSGRKGPRRRREKPERDLLIFRVSISKP